jgi:PAS domain S-box-containing protein
MKDEQKTKEQLMKEVVELRQQLAELEALELKHKKAEEELAKHRNQLEKLVKKRTAELENRNEQLKKEITERKKLEEVLRKSEKQASAAIEAVRALTFSYDVATGKIDWGGAIEEITGCTKEEFAKVDIEGWAERIHPDDRDEILSVLREAMGKDRATAEYRFRTKKGYVTLSSISLTEKQDGKPVRLVGILQDVTELKEMQEKMVRSERLVVLGQLAGGVGHELRNPLGAIKNAAYFLNMALEQPEPEVKETLEILEREVATSERIVSSLLDFACPKSPTRRKVDINEVVLEVLSRNNVPENIEVLRQLEESLPAILADPDQLGQVFSNIIRNGIQAMPEGGRLLVKSKVLNPEWVAISITDTGVGIPPKERPKVFEPLFTSKAKGIGLGLALTKTLVGGHGGSIEILSKVGKGSTFRVKLPISGEREN